MKTITEGTAPDVGGESLYTAFPKFNFNTKMMQYRQKFLGRLPIFDAGDSMMGNGLTAGWGAFIAAARYLHYDVDILFDDRRYFDTDTSVKLPDGQRGFAFATGGKDTQHMLDVQLPAILECYNQGILPPVCFLAPYHNDRFYAVGAAAASVARCMTFINALLSRGITVVCFGVWPQNDIGETTESSFGKHYVEQRMLNIARSTPGLIYVPILDILKRGSPAEEVRSLTNWKGVKDDIGGATGDDIHLNPYGARLIAGRVAAALRLIAPEWVPPVFDLRPFDQARNPYANYLGAAGRFLLGGGGKINGATNANMPLGSELIYDTTKGYTLTPTLTNDPLEPVELSITGTPTAEDQWVVRLRNDATASATMELYAQVRWVNAKNWSGIAIGDGRLGIEGTGQVITAFPGAGSIGGRKHIMPDALNEVVTLRSTLFGFNVSNRSVPVDITGAVMPGLQPTGTLRLRRIGMFKSDVNIRGEAA